jgi:hypothetical protein
MAEADVKKRFLNERKLNVQSDVAKVKKEYDAIISCINGLLAQVVSMLFCVCVVQFFFIGHLMCIFFQIVHVQKVIFQMDVNFLQLGFSS